MSYNGWKNKETWLVSLWADFGEEYLEPIAKEFWGEEYSTMVNRVADILKSEYEEHVQNKLEECGERATLMADLVETALAEIDWYELVENNIHWNESDWEDHLNF